MLPPSKAAQDSRYSSVLKIGTAINALSYNGSVLVVMDNTEDQPKLSSTVDQLYQLMQRTLDFLTNAKTTFIEADENLAAQISNGQR